MNVTAYYIDRVSHNGIFFHPFWGVLFEFCIMWSYPGVYADYHALQRTHYFHFVLLRSLLHFLQSHNNNFQTTTSQVPWQKKFKTIQQNSLEPNLHSSCPPGPTLLITPRIGSNRLLQSEGFLPASTKMPVKVIFFLTIIVFCKRSKFASTAPHFCFPFSSFFMNVIWIGQDKPHS